MSHAESTRVFISYSWENDVQRERVLGLAQRLRQNGIDAWIDRFTPFPSKGWSRWMRDEIQAARFVLCIITKTYAERFLGHSARGVGRGANWEGSIITNDIYHNAGSNEKFIPVVFDAVDADFIPYPLSDYAYFHVEQPDGYDSLYRLLTDQPEVLPANLGAVQPMLPAAMPSPLSQPQVYFHRRNLGNLPRLPYFVGRDDPLKIIDEALRPTARTWIILIDGPGGIGKTTLAIRAAELASEEDYPRIVFVSAKVRELEPDRIRAVRDFLINSYLDLLNSIARELGDDSLAKLDEKERPEALLRLLRDKPALLVLDNLESLPKEDMERLLEFLRYLPAKSKAIITSRRRTDIQAEIIRLDQMHWSDAAKLLAELARRSPLLASASEQERHTLYNNTGGNPLILRWVAGQLGRGRCRTLDEALKLLRASPAGNAALEFIFGDLADQFTPEEMKLLAALTYFTQPVAVNHIAELAELSPLIAQVELEHLADRSLVVGDAELRYFILTPLVADFLRRQKPEVVRESGDRLANAVYAMVIEKGYERYSCFPQLEEGWPMIEAALPVLDYDKLQTACDALGPFLGRVGRWDESIALSRLAEDKAAARSDFWKAGWRACQEASLMFYLRNPEAVEAGVTRATKYWQKATPMNNDLGTLSRRWGMLYELQENYSAALDAYRKALGLWRLHSQESGYVATALNDIAGIERRMKDYEAAEQNYKEALRIAQKLNYAGAVAIYTGNLADLALDREQWSEAEDLARRALVPAHTVRDRELVAANYWRIAKALFQQEQPAEGMPYARKAVKVFASLHSPALAKAKETLQEFEETLERLGIAADVSSDPSTIDEAVVFPNLAGGDQLSEGRSLYEMGLALQRQGWHREAEMKFQEALAIWRELPRTIEEAKTRNSLGWSYQQQKRWAEAERCYEEARAICKEIYEWHEYGRSEENLQRLNEERAQAAARDGPLRVAETGSLRASAPSPFELEIQAYEQADLLSPPAKGGLLFYGSSSIRLWPSVERDFPDYPVLNRGFGGATLQDCVRAYPRLVKPYAPRLILLYSGDNDLADGHSPQHVLASLQAFLDLLEKDFPSTLVALISIKPSPIHQNQREIQETNRLVEALVSQRDNLTFINIYPKMLKPDGSPNELLFLDDRLHMAQAGYDIWKEAVASYLSVVWSPPAKANPQVTGLNREYHRWFSRHLGRVMELLVFGHAGVRVLVFPTWRGRFHQYEDNGVVDVLRRSLADGALQLFCVDSFDSHAMYNQEISPRERIVRHLSFERYILEEVLPFSEGKNPHPSVAVQGCSLGAFHAVNIAFRYPDRFDSVLALSGRYDLTRSFDGYHDLFDGYYDDDIYFNMPSHFIPNLTDVELLRKLRRLNITLGVGERDVFLENNRTLSLALWDKGVAHTFRLWQGKSHNFDNWREMVRLYTVAVNG